MIVQRLFGVEFWTRLEASAISRLLEPNIRITKSNISPKQLFVKDIKVSIWISRQWKLVIIVINIEM